MFNVYFKGEELPGKHDYEGGKLLACVLHAEGDAEVSLIDDETGEIVFEIFEDGEDWAVYEVDPNAVEEIEILIVIEI